ncbi:uncharacterized protein HMPREF1541_09598 [Cyphellophora europaea CBS 101466]|uniref:Uncharacterized protein n=1 Tax=Cyphellophora europaea (strain CBS 101466) TaxID=1220924 RepID=W2SAW1_CYPE1|nr:uncharacterized protein HMPREF1541_09598 [Cyphellophora europaea CBS 101466]ETN45765.1 hypothetical protein HMPREF1541_09598 [Cyphellophora europaea CBS 101466]
MAPLVQSLLLAVAALMSLVAADNATCYNLFGQADDSLRPCGPNADVSACCRKDDICLSSGLCMSTASSWAGFIWANGCTDATHADKACPSQCQSKTSVNTSSSFNVLQCTFPFSNGTEQRDPQWCCRSATDYDNCCSDPTLTFNDTQNIGIFLTPGSTKAINPADAYIPAADCASTNTSSSNTTAEQPSCPADHTAAVGGAVGGVLGAALLGALATIFLLLRNRKALRGQVTAVGAQRDDALKQVSDEKSVLAQLQAQQQQQQQQQQRFSAGGMGQGQGQGPMMGYQQSGAFDHGQMGQGQGQPPAPGYGNGHIYNQYSENGSFAGTSPMGPPPPAEMSATKYAEMDGSGTPMELSVQEVQPTPEASRSGGSLGSKVSD